MKTSRSLSKLTPDVTLAQIISADQKAAELLASIGLDVSRNKDKTLREVCTQRQWSEEEVMKWIKRNQPSQRENSEENHTEEKPDFRNNMPALCDHLEDEYHALIFDLLSEIRSNFPKVHKIHGNQYTWLKSADWHFNELDETLLLSLTFRKERLFPLVRQLQDQKNDTLDGTIRKLRRSVRIIKKDQNKMIRLMETIKELSNGFVIPEGACSTFRILIHNFRTLYSRLEEQFNLERETLIPAVQQKITMI